MRLFNKKKKLIQINYKSGHREFVHVDSLKKKVLDGKIIELEWVNMRPSPFLVGLDDIESIWVLS
jgi:hypothetical protein